MLSVVLALFLCFRRAFSSLVKLDHHQQMKFHYTPSTISRLILSVSSLKNHCRHRERTEKTALMPNEVVGID
ncbi:unnamed protein product [Linum tenue]|uniref:Secreted protein n=1 Tax=Linum tenue TaxID=586396 RepID=A0AAV0QRN3_9ROSI|nr:unnamed protein product [Linum tenue]